MFHCLIICLAGAPLSEQEALAGWLDLLDGKGFGWTQRDGWTSEPTGWKAGEKAVARHGAILGPCKAAVRVKATGPNPALFLNWIAPDGTKTSFVWKPDGINAESPVWSPDLGKVPAGSLELLGSGVHVSELRLLPNASTGLIIGKDLSGWNVFPNKKSRYSVTKEGYIHVEDGPGDIQSSFQAADFVARLTVRTNGKHLNSGLFFRAIPGEFTQAYEAQIRNEFTPGESREYKVDKFDPATHQPAGSSMVRSEAIDFGTGAIYRRVPARSQASKDGSWFTMTVAAHGRRMATWVNGIQQVDWTDNRPANPNPRQGFRAAQGAFSLQGHDPTTNIDFRSLDIQVLDPSPKTRD